MYLQFLRKRILGVCMVATALAAGCTSQEKSGDSQSIDREYVLDAKMIGYTGIGGEIDGRRNPVLRAKKGERVKISLIHGELMDHDIVLEKYGVQSETMLEEGENTSVVFIAEDDDSYYCSLPGHEHVMPGEFKIVSDFEATASDN